MGGKNRKETARFSLHSLMLLFQSTFAPLSGLFCGRMGPLSFHTICNVLGRTKLFILLKKVSMGVQNVIYLIILSIDSGYRFKCPKYSYLTCFSSGIPACFHLKYGVERCIIVSLMSFQVPPRDVLPVTPLIDSLVGQIAEQLQLFERWNHIFLFVKCFSDNINEK